MDRSLKGPGQSALDDAFHAMFERSRSEPAPTRDQRLDRLRAEAAGRNLTPITLELGGKSPVIVDRSADGLRLRAGHRGAGFRSPFAIRYSPFAPQ